MKITVSAQEFDTFISAITTLNRVNGASITIHRDYLDTIMMDEHNAEVIMYARVNILNPDETGLDGDEIRVINIPNLSKFERLLSMNEKETFTFQVVNNSIVYKGTYVKGAKFILNENPPKPISKHITLDWFKQFKTHFKCSLSKQNIKQIIQCAAFTGLESSPTKAYFYTDNDNLCVELNDRKQVNVDNMTLNLTSEFEGTITKIPIKASTLTLVTCDSSNITFEAASISQGSVSYEVLLLTVENDNVYLKYMLNAIRD